MGLYLTLFLALWPFFAATQTPQGFCRPRSILSMSYFRSLGIWPSARVIRSLKKVSSVSTLRKNVKNQLLKNQQDTELPPAIIHPAHRDPNTKYFIIMIDLDIPITSKITATGLHWLAQDLIYHPSHKNLTDAVGRSQNIVAPYKSPNPLFNSGVHRYVIMLFKQPCEFVFPKKYAYLDPPKKTALRIGFNTTKFVEAAELELVAATYWLEVNGTLNGNATELNPKGGAGTSGASAGQVTNF